MGISRDKWHKRRSTGGKQALWRKKRKFEMGRPPANTKLGQKRVRTVRTRGGNRKFRALRLDSGNFSWGSETITKKTRIVDVVYNASNNELVSTKTLVKGCIIQIDATPFRQWYEAHYGIPLGKKRSIKDLEKDKADAKLKLKQDVKSPKGNKETKELKKVPETKATTAPSKHVRYKLAKRKLISKLEQQISDQFNSGKLYACVSSRPGQCGRCDGYVLEGKELEFYGKKVKK
ncbi:40S ribosomal protein S8-like [Oopsacas minuta]|uniref:40S ribosomal protein S8 n=1 Tax=Oopsacas minuta TaxID=111878 RepID=A0AAV7KBQ0_9METZ|nr:40S ribosomal protein S8-like [Oopsacas minuta]